MEEPTSKKTKKPTTRANHKGNIKFLNPLPVETSISNKEREGPPERMTSLEEPSLTSTASLKIETACARCDTLCQ
jgi:hypothetical protein